MANNRRRSSLPCSAEHIPFCVYMGYELREVDDQFHWYYIPSGHMCRFLTNFDSWQDGTFDKEKFIKNLKSN